MAKKQKNSKPLVIIYNPASGKGRGAECARLFAEQAQKELGAEVRLRPTSSLPDLLDAAQSLKPAKEIGVFIGGDGTLCQCLQGMFLNSQFAKIKQPVGILPGGTGNSFHREFGIETFEEASDLLIEAIRNNERISVDAGILEYENRSGRQKQVFVNLWAVGIIPLITKLGTKMRFLGHFNYILATLVLLLRHRPFQGKVEIDKKKKKLHYNFLAICNSRYTAKSMKMAPQARVNDGHLEMVFSNPPSRFSLLKLFPKIFSGTHIEHERVYNQTIKSFKLLSDKEYTFMYDGELGTGYNLQMKVMPGLWQLYMPRRVVPV